MTPAHFAGLRIIARLLISSVAAAAAIAGCASANPPPLQPLPQPLHPTAASPARAGAAEVLTTIPVSAANLVAASYAELPHWASDDHGAALAAFRSGCPVLEKSEAWRAVCSRARDSASDRNPREFFETSFRVFRVVNGDGTDTGMVTGYYEPLLHGSRVRTTRYAYPIYSPPDDLISVDVADVYPETRDLRLRGRLSGNRLVPYYTRAEIEAGHAPLAGKEILWVDNRIELFFLHIQGSGRVELPDGTVVHIGYANTNGYSYRSIGRALIERGQLSAEQASMQAIRAWALLHPDQVDSVLNLNPSYVFFRVLSVEPAGGGGADGGEGAPGTLGVPLIPGRSIAVDTRFIPLGAPVYLATTRPLSSLPLERTVVAHDTGNAIRGAVRADYFWGAGAEADREAGRMRQQGRMWLLLPREYPVHQG